MAAILITIICVAMTVVGGMTLSQGILTSADIAATNANSISIRDSEISRTELDILRAAQLSWADYIRVTVKNSGQTKLFSFDKWDMIVSYEDSGGILYTKWLPYTTSLPVNNKWYKARIGLDGPIEFFEPGILNPLEEMVALIDLNPSMGTSTSGEISIATPNGIYTTFQFLNLGYTRFTAQSENITLANTKYYELVEATPADGTTIYVRADFEQNEIARKLLYNVNQSTRPSEFIYPLKGITEIPAANWTVTYRCFLSNGFLTAANDYAYLNIDIKIVTKDGAVRDTINVSPAAEVSLNRDQLNMWLTVSGNYNFSGYTVLDDDDYLEIDFYAQTKEKVNDGYILISIDDNTLPIVDQTRIEA